MVELEAISWRRKCSVLPKLGGGLGGEVGRHVRDGVRLSRNFDTGTGLCVRPGRVSIHLNEPAFQKLPGRRNETRLVSGRVACNLTARSCTAELCSATQETEGNKIWDNLLEAGDREKEKKTTVFPISEFEGNPSNAPARRSETTRLTSPSQGT